MRKMRATRCSVYTVALFLCRNVGALRSLDLTSHLLSTRWVASALAPEAKKKKKCSGRCRPCARKKDVGPASGPIRAARSKPRKPIARSLAQRVNCQWEDASLPAGRSQCSRVWARLLHNAATLHPRTHGMPPQRTKSSKHLERTTVPDPGRHVTEDMLPDPHATIHPQRLSSASHAASCRTGPWKVLQARAAGRSQIRISWQKPSYTVSKKPERNPVTCGSRKPWALLRSKSVDNTTENSI